MRRWWYIIQSSLLLTLEDIRRNRLRTFLSLFGVTIGIFCIIGVLATVNSLEINIRNEISALGNNTIYIDKWEWGGGPDYPRWKYLKRPLPRYEEMQEILERTPAASHAAFFINSFGPVEHAQLQLPMTRIYGVSSDYPSIQPLSIAYGRMPAEKEFSSGAPLAIIGDEIATQLFGEASMAPGQLLRVKGQLVTIAGVMRKQGSQILGGWQFDKSVILPFAFLQPFVDLAKSAPIIMVKGAPGISSKVLKDELQGAMRAVRRLNIRQEDNFSLNDVNDFGKTLSKAFISINTGGWIIGALAFIVGIFGVANIMFVTVKERTTQIGLKKAIGAENRYILTEFLLESALLCILGGLIGLLMVFLLTQVVQAVFSFPLFLSPSIVALAIGICILAGILAGFIPARQAARLDPVKAIRS